MPLSPCSTASSNTPTRVAEAMNLVHLDRNRYADRAGVVPPIVRSALRSVSRVASLARRRGADRVRPASPRFCLRCPRTEEHHQQFTTGGTISAVIQRKPRALRNGAPSFVELAARLPGCQQRMLVTPGGDRARWSRSWPSSSSMTNIWPCLPQSNWRWRLFGVYEDPYRGTTCCTAGQTGSQRTRLRIKAPQALTLDDRTPGRRRALRCPAQVREARHAIMIRSQRRGSSSCCAVCKWDARHGSGRSRRADRTRPSAFEAAGRSSRLRLKSARRPTNEVRSTAYCAQSRPLSELSRPCRGFDRFASSEVNEALARQPSRLGGFLEGCGTTSWSAALDGKTHLATAIGVQAIEHHRKRVRFFSTVELVNALEQERSFQGKPGQIAARLTHSDLVILDELGYLPFSASGGALLFHLLCKLL